MTDTYKVYEKTTEWKVIQQAINDLVENQDLIIKTKLELIIGYLTKHIIENKQKELK